MFENNFKLLDACDFNAINFCKQLFTCHIKYMYYFILNKLFYFTCILLSIFIYSTKFDISEGILKFMKYRLNFLVFELHN